MAGQERLVALTMTPEAANQFWYALNYAASRIPPDARRSLSDEMSHEDWLRWGASRLDAAMAAMPEQPHTRTLDVKRADGGVP